MKQLSLILLTDNKQGIVLCVAHSKRRRVSGALWPSILAEICELQESEILFQNPIWTAPEKPLLRFISSPHMHTHTLSLLLTNTTNLVWNIFSYIRNIPHCKEGVKAGAFLCFMGIGFIGESIGMGNWGQKHLNAYDEILQKSTKTSVIFLAKFSFPN